VTSNSTTSWSAFDSADAYSPPTRHTMSTVTTIKHPDGTAIVCTSTGSGAAASPAPPQIDLMYFPIAGRGELIRLIAAVGGVSVKETFPGPDWKSKCGFFGSLPMLEHGPLKMCQSLACQTYAASIAPLYADLTPQQRAVDNMYMCTFEDMLAVCPRPSGRPFAGAAPP
jgi:hypothetical protein